MVNNLGNSSTFTVSFRRDSVRYLTIRGEAGERIYEKNVLHYPDHTQTVHLNPIRKKKNQAGIQLIGVMPKKELIFRVLLPIC